MPTAAFAPSLAATYDFSRMRRVVDVGGGRGTLLVAVLAARTHLEGVVFDLPVTPKQNSSGGKPKLGRISKMGNRNLRKLLVVGPHAVLFHRKPHTDPLRMWAKKLIEKKPFKLVAVALANKMARIAFAILRSKTVYREIPA